MSKIRMSLAVALIAMLGVTGMGIVFMAMPAPSQTLVKLAERPTTTPTLLLLPGCGPGGC